MFNDASTHTHEDGIVADEGHSLPQIYSHTYRIEEKKILCIGMTLFLLLTAAGDQTINLGK